MSENIYLLNFNIFPKKNNKITFSKSNAKSNIEKKLTKTPNYTNLILSSTSLQKYFLLYESNEIHKIQKSSVICNKFYLDL